MNRLTHPLHEPLVPEFEQVRFQFMKKGYTANWDGRHMTWMVFDHRGLYTKDTAVHLYFYNNEEPAEIKAFRDSLKRIARYGKSPKKEAQFFSLEMHATDFNKVVYNDFRILLFSKKIKEGDTFCIKEYLLFKRTGMKYTGNVITAKIIATINYKTEEDMHLCKFEIMKINDVDYIFIKPKTHQNVKA